MFTVGFCVLVRLVSSFIHIYIYISEFTQRKQSIAIFFVHTLGTHSAMLGLFKQYNVIYFSNYIQFLNK